jgi:hypothetical protein
MPENEHDSLGRHLKISSDEVRETTVQLASVLVIKPMSVASQWPSRRGRLNL